MIQAAKEQTLTTMKSRHKSSCSQKHIYRAHDQEVIMSKRRKTGLFTSNFCETLNVMATKMHSKAQEFQIESNSESIQEMKEV